MSVITIDYLPFDYLRYAQEILPALQQATEGDGAPLCALLQSASHFSFGPRSLHRLPLSNNATLELLEPDVGFQGILDVAAIRRIGAGEAVNPWEYFAAVIPSLEGRTLENLGKYGSLLQFHLLYTFCCEPPPPPWTSSYPILPHDEPVFDWYGYTARDEETRALWGAFNRLLPPDLARWLHLSSNTDEGSSRKLGLGYREHITGFITTEEALNLLEHVRTSEAPLLDSIISGCIRDGESAGWTIDTNLISDELLLDDPGDEWFCIKQGDQYIRFKTIFEHWMAVHPEEMAAFLQRYYQNLWQVEKEVLGRLRYAVSRGWGVLQTYYS